MDDRKRLASGLLASAGLTAMLVGGLATPALAQDASEEIIVVAQRRAENLQDVPINVSVLSSDRLTAATAGGSDILALSATVPGLNVESSNGRAAPRFYIRGLGNTDFDLAASQPVSIIMDDVVLENVTLRSFPLFDIDHVEVLRGPQGTLFGRNTIAGLVNIISARPTDTFEAGGNASYGSFGSANVEGFVSGPLAQGLSARGSVNYRRRDDWIDNTYGGGGTYASEIGGFEDWAGRVQVLFEPTDNFNALLNVHARSLSGNSASVFRGDFFVPGTNDPQPGFDRERVSYNGGAGNPQEYDAQGAALTLTWDFSGMTLTSITGYDTIEGRSRGDIDGTSAPDSDTQDSIDDHHQTTQEFRLASDVGGPFSWQVGAYYFDSALTITTVGAGFPPPTTVEHTNTSWALFGQGTWAFTDQLSLAAGVRYTDDSRDFRGVNVVTPARSVSDAQTTGDLALTYRASPDLTLFGRVATGFRAPSIQGRDVAFGSTASVAQSETALSYEAGMHGIVLNGTGRINASVFHYTIQDMQFTVIGGAGNSNALINADEGVGYGFDLDGEFDVTDNFSVNFGLNYTHTEINDPDLLVAPCGAGGFFGGGLTGECTVLDPTVPRTINGNANTQVAVIDGNPFPQAPEFTFNFGGRYTIPTSGGGEWFVDTDWNIRGPLNFFLYEAVEFRTNTQVEGNLRLGYARQDGAYEIALFARNVTDEVNVIGAIDFANLTGFVNEPRVIGVSLSARMD